MSMYFGIDRTGSQVVLSIETALALIGWGCFYSRVSGVLIGSARHEKEHPEGH
jgi:hypothetical protein